MQRNNPRVATLVESDFKLTVGTLTHVTFGKTISGNVAKGAVDNEKASGNVAVGRPENYMLSTSVCSRRCAVATRYGQTRLDLSFFARHQLSSAEHINHQSTCRLGVAEQHLHFILIFEYLLQTLLTVSLR